MILPVTVLAAIVDFITSSHAELGTSFQGKIPDKFDVSAITTQEEAAKYPFTWWRDTTNQNSLWEHTASEFTNAIIPAYTDTDLNVLVFNGLSGANVVAIIGPSGNTIIGCGGSRNGAKLALSAF